MKKLNKKTILLIALAAIMMVGVGGTLAYLIDNSGPVTNTFTPATVETEITEDFNTTSKTEVIIKNTGKTDAYIRVAVVGNWMAADGTIIEPWDGSFTIGTDWLKIGDYYYYTKPVAALTGETTNLLGSSSIELTKKDDGSYLEIVVIQQSIQAVPVSVVQDEWSVTVNTNSEDTIPDGTITQ